MDTRKCPLCGRPNDCQLCTVAAYKGPCWCAKVKIPDELVAGMSLIGDAGFVKDRIAAYRESGVTVLNVQPVGPNGLRDVETIAEWVD